MVASIRPVTGRMSPASSRRASTTGAASRARHRTCESFPFGFSTRPGVAEPVSEEEERRRVLPVIRDLKRRRPTAVVSVGDHVQLSPQTAQSVSVSVPPDYPLLARQMKVQGAVRLQALISREGTIQELQILSGPSILATAAREAVKQWHFKPYIQNGQPVETQARITVNFTISTN